MDSKRDPRSTAPLKDPAIPSYIQSKFDEALADLRRHTQQQKREEEERPRHSLSPYGRRHPSTSWRPRDRLRGEEAGHPRSEAPRRDHHQTEEYDPQGNETENSYHKLICPQGLKISPKLLAAFFDNISISKPF
jgi:hypothetical protein